MSRLLFPICSVSLFAFACSGDSVDADQLMAPGDMAGSSSTGGSGVATGGSGGAGGAVASAGSAAGGEMNVGGATGGAAGSVSMAGTAGAGGQMEMGPYAPRTGPFKMLVYSNTQGFRHEGSIATGKVLLQQIGAEQGFEVQITENNDLITPEGLADFEILYFMNPTGDIFNDQQEQIFEDWMTDGGAFAGNHSATDTENGWAFYSEVTGQYYNGHTGQGQAGRIDLEAGALDFPALVGLPNPWQRNEEWYRFNNFNEWSTKPGFQMLGRVTTNDVTAGQPIMWYREWGGFRAFYTAIGHAGEVFEDADVKKHLTGGIMWAVRREAEIK